MQRHIPYKIQDSKRWFFFAILLALLIFSTSATQAQRITASLKGTVHDSTAARIPNATVTLTNTGTQANFKGLTDSTGSFDISNLPPGPYTVTIEATGFKRLVRSGLILDVDQTAGEDFTLELGTVSETVQVTSAEPLLETQSSDVGAVIENKSIENLPLNQRNPFSLVLLVPGVTGTVNASFTGLQFNVNGGRAGNTDVLLDGVPAAPPTDDVTVLSIFPSVDATQEFKVQTSNFSAQFGNAAGGIINILYKSGTNSLHGSVYDFLRNSYLDANNYFSDQLGYPLPAFRRNQFGFSLGGPVYLPKLYHGRDKTFFFVDYEGLRQTQAAQLTTTVPTLAERGGDFSADATSSGAAISIYDPRSTVATVTSTGTVYTRTQFPNNKIDPSLFDPVAANILKYYPLPNTAGQFGHNNYVVNASTPTSINQYDIKVDQIFSDRQRLSFRFSKRNPVNGFAHEFPAAIQVAQNASTGSQPAIGAGLDYTFAKSSSYIFELRAGVSHVYYNTATASDGFDPTTLGFPPYLAAAAIASSATSLTFPGIAPAGYLAIGAGSQQGKGTAGYLQDSFLINNTKVLSHHTLNFGGEFRILANNSNQNGEATGAFSFGTNFTQGGNALTASSTSGDGFASFLLGLGSGSEIQAFKISDTTSHYAAAYLQDDWKASDKWTFNAGLRYELFIPRTERKNRTTWLDLNVPSPLALTTTLTGLKGGLEYAGVNGNPRTTTDGTYLDFAPRVGFAYHPTTSLVVRGAFGIFFADSPNQAAATVQNTGYRATTPYNGTLNGATPNAYLSNPFPTGFVPPTGNTLGLLTSTGSSIVSQLRRQPAPYSENYQLGVEYQLPGNWLIGVTYVGNHGVQLPYSPTYNQLPDSDLALGAQLLTAIPNNPLAGKVQVSGPISGATIQQRYLLSAYPQFTAVNGYQVAGAISHYDSIQIKVERRFSKSATVLLSYTGSKSLDDYSISNSNFGSNGTYQDASIPLMQDSYAPSTFDIPKNLVVSAVYSLPFGRGERFGSNWNRLVDAIFGGYQVNGIYSAHNGTPIALSASNVANIFNPGERPNYNGQDPKLPGRVEDKLKKYFNTSSFSQPATYTFGNTARTLGYLRNPGLTNLDISVFKQFSMVDGIKTEIRGEAFNAFNTPAFSGPDAGVTDGTFGQITSQANTPREIQVAVKILF
ncbi:TonB-dependent receptor [Granulicella mallensis]|uniref:TonB-dependent receptor plug n=1 Tax=Granulicella mallensis (strain ATCC BAA-1857 / DSM 23137 / MP5ACTX8) TaxID=682795 RepID=G8P068_GRAMM|nr:TonB-dependent receptor [Granulicella mallensis]AEU36862.1 TonB-dependent receptor plug [Granulicella mallensis MP5ACTX8]